MPETFEISTNKILTLVFFLVTNVVVAFPFHIPVPGVVVGCARRVLSALHILSPAPKPSRTLRIPIDFLTGPIIAILVLLAAGAISGDVIRDGIVGTDGVNPIDIMALFISLAYITISLDTTGLFRFLALWVAKKGGSSGRRLYVLLFLFFLAAAVFVGNDPVVLSGTPFLAYFSQAIDIAPTAWIFAQFAAANMTSTILISSNITNLVLAGAFSLTFLQYTSNVVVPVIISSILVIPVLLFLFRSPNYIPPVIHTMEIIPSSALTDKDGAFFGAALLLVTLGVLVGTNVLHVPVWMITVPPAVIMLSRDILHDRKRWTDSPCDPVEMKCCAKKCTPSSIETETEPLSKPWTVSHSTTQACRRVHGVFPTCISVLGRLPLPLLPFTFSMFILVQALVKTGWVVVFAGWWTAIAQGGGVVGAIVSMSAISCILCNACGTNIGMTILLSRVLQVWIESSAPGPRIKNGVIFALAIGSNYGAFTLTFSASLAGMLWRSILADKGITVPRLQFALLNTPIVAATMGVASAVLIAQVYIVHSA